MNFIKEDGVIFKIFNTVYYSLITSFLWYVFSFPVIVLTFFIILATGNNLIYSALPFFGTGASTAAIFYCIGKFQREGDVSTIKSYWKSFKENFKQGALLSFLFSVIYLVACANLSSLNKFGNYSTIVEISQFVILFQLSLVNIYTHFLLSRVEMTTKDMIMSAFIICNKHFSTTIFCALGLIVTVFISFYFASYLIIFIPGIYALIVCFFVENVIKKYIKTEEEKQEEL